MNILYIFIYFLECRFIPNTKYITKGGIGLKESRFNVIKPRDNGILIYNTYTGTILYLNDEYSKQYQIAKEKGFEEESELVENLKKGKMIVPENIDENEMLLVSNRISRFSDAIKNYTIAPTMKCNFRCPYCYEKNVEYKSMDRSAIEAMKNLFRKDKESAKKMFITWYGGEPLVRFDIIEELSAEVIRLFEDDYVASMVTNGYLLTPEIAKKLYDLKIGNLQITIDGPPDIHNSRRRLYNGKDTFFVILKNIKKTTEIAPNVRITIRVNTDKTNINRVDEIIHYLDEYQISDKVGFYLAPVDNINNTCNSVECFTPYEFAKEEIRFIQRNIDKYSQFVRLPHRNTNICGAVACNSYVIDADGHIYKCWNDIGDKMSSIGTIFDSEIQWNANLTKWLSYDIINDKECMDCKFLPVCMGGCPSFKLKNNEKKCSPIKENVDEMMNLLYEYRKARQ